VEPIRENAEPLVLGVRLDEDGIKENVGAIIVHEDGHVEAFLHDEWQPWLPDHGAVLQHLLSLGVEEFIVGVLHDERAGGGVGERCGVDHGAILPARHSPTRADGNARSPGSCDDVED
ncbi:hypothetical protein IAE22_32695, partial [Bacillus sp. S34]|nr:hypothetical protein [Bacillus sp. S34]